MATLILLAAMFVLLWVLLIRPQRRRQQEQQRLLSSVEPGDEVLTVGGIYGIVRGIDEEDDLIVEIAEGIQVRVARRAVGGVVKPDETTRRSSRRPRRPSRAKSRGRRSSIVKMVLPTPRNS